MRVFPVEFLKGKTTIGLNQSCTLTVHPELYLEHERLRRDDPKRAKMQWIIKKKPPMAGLETNDSTHYVFHTRRDLEVVRTRERDTLHPGEGVQTTAIDLAVRLGARQVVLVGCDGASLGGACPSPRVMHRRNGCTTNGKTLGRRAATADRTRRARLAGIAVGVHRDSRSGSGIDAGLRPERSSRIRSSSKPKVFYDNLRYRAGAWDQARRVVVNIA